MSVELGVPASRLETAVHVLSQVRELPGATATDLVDRTGLSRPTVLGACDELIRAGWVVELSSTRPTGLGRPARTFAIAEDAGAVVGVDLGAKSVSVAVADLLGTVLAESGQRLRESALAATRIDAINRHIDAACERAGVPPDQLASIVVGVPAPAAGGVINAAPGYLRDLPKVRLDELLAERYPHARISLDNDANLAALAERSTGAAIGCDNLVALLASDRLGAGVVVDGQLLHGARGAVGEIGVLTVLPGLVGLTGIAPLVRDAAAAAVRDRPASYRRLASHVRADGSIEAATVFDAAIDNPAIGRLVVSALRPVSLAIAVLHVLFDPELIVICGAVAAAPGLIDALYAGLPVREELTSLRPIRLVASPHGRRAAQVGALTAAHNAAWNQLYAGTHAKHQHRTQRMSHDGQTADRPRPELEHQ